MNARVAKATRRELTRTLGRTGLALVENHGEALETRVLPALKALNTIANDTDRRLNDLEAFRKKSFRQRIAWVLFGD